MFAGNCPSLLSGLLLQVTLVQLTRGQIQLEKKGSSNLPAALYHPIFVTMLPTVQISVNRSV